MARIKDALLDEGKPGQEQHFYDNIVTVARTHSPRLVLTKIVYPNGDSDSFSSVAHYDFYPRPVFNMNELHALLAKVMLDTRSCFLRSVPMDNANVRNVRRICRNDNPHGPPTLIEWPQNWFALDIDNYARSTGNIELDACRVLLSLPPVFRDARCLALATSSYGGKTKMGISLRLWFWNDTQITSYDLRRYFESYYKVVDLGLFGPAQCIYVAPPIFVGCADPIAQRLVEINPQGILTDIKHQSDNYHGGAEMWYSKQQAKAFMSGIFDRVSAAEYQGDPPRHKVLIREAIFMGRLVGQEHFSREYGYDWLWMACETWDDSGATETRISRLSMMDWTAAFAKLVKHSNSRGRSMDTAETLEVCWKIFNHLNEILKEKLAFNAEDDAARDALKSWILSQEGQDVLLADLALLKQNSPDYYKSILEMLSPKFLYKRGGWTDLEKLINARVDKIIKDTRYQDMSWGQRLIANKNGLLNNDLNAYTILTNHPDAVDALAYNEFTSRIVYLKRPAWWQEGIPFDASKPVDNSDITDILLWLQSTFKGYDLHFQKLNRVVNRVAMLNSFNPVLDWIKECHEKWISNGRINRLSGPALIETTKKVFRSYVAQMVPDDRDIMQDLVPIYFRNQLGTLVRRVKEPGCQVDTMVMLIGRQGLNKSKYGPTLVGNELYNQHLSTADKMADIARSMEDYVIGEMNEMSTIRKSDVETAKALISTSRIVFIPKYSNYKTEAKVNWIYVGTSNKIGILRDHENRRFWVIEVLEPINIEWLAENRDELIGEAYEMFCGTTDRKYHFEQDDWMAKGLAQANMNYTEELPNQDVVGDYVSGFDQVFVNNVNCILRSTISEGPYGRTITVSPATQANVNLCEPIMRMLGFERGKRTWTKDRDGNDRLWMAYNRSEGSQKAPGGNQIVDPIEFLKKRYPDAKDDSAF